MKDKLTAAIHLHPPSSIRTVTRERRRGGRGLEIGMHRGGRGRGLRSGSRFDLDILDRPMGDDHLPQNSACDAQETQDEKCDHRRADQQPDAQQDERFVPPGGRGRARGRAGRGRPLRLGRRGPGLSRGLLRLWGWIFGGHGIHGSAARPFTAGPAWAASNCTTPRG